MNSDIINWDKTPQGSDVEVLSVFYAFKSISEYIADKKEINDLKLKLGRKEKVTEEGFREFLKIIVSVSWDEVKLTENQILTLNMIYNYLKTPYKQDEQPIVGNNTITLEELKNKYSGG